MFIKRVKNGETHYVTELSPQGVILKLDPSIGKAVSFSTKEALACELYYRNRENCGELTTIAAKGDATISPGERAEQELKNKLTTLSAENATLRRENVTLKAERDDAKAELEMLTEDVKAKAAAAKAAEDKAKEDAAKKPTTPPVVPPAPPKP